MSSGKVKCTCGWSWNKSDSSKKDMYICHECGRDNSNNMKNGGWLDSYANGGTMQEHQENYNDYKVSAPEGMIGDGFSNEGRNYSPAWGGQFQTGGYLKKEIKKTERDLLKKYVDPTQARALIRAKQQGINTGAHNGPLDAIRHSSSAAAMSSILPSWANFIPGVAPINILATNIAGAAHELNSPNTLKEHASDLYNNFIGSAVGVLPISEESKHNLLIQAQKHGVLSDMGNKISSASKLPKLRLPPLPKRQMGGFVYPVNYVPQAQMGASIPGAVGFSYARTQSPAPSNGPYAKKTKASAQNGQEMKYYQEGLDFKPKTISRYGSVIEDDLGQWAHPGEITEINSNDITMEGVPYDVLGISDIGDTKLMKPGKKYKFKGKKVIEFPMAKNGLRQEQKGLVNLDQLTNFTNYNTKQPGGWLDKY